VTLACAGLIGRFALAVCGLQPTQPAEVEPASSQPAPPAPSGPQPQIPARPGAAGWGPPILSTRVFPEGVKTEDDYAAWLSDTATRLAREADDAREPATKVERLLTAANFILARQIEPAASRSLLGISEAADARSMALHVSTATAMLVETEKLTGSLEPSEELREERLSAWRDAHQTLDAFARALAAFALSANETPPASRPAGEAESSKPEADETDPQHVQRLAAAGLAVCLEDDRPAVVAAALLWQSVLFGGIGEVDRAMRLLPLATRSVGRAAGSLEFYARLQRCRYTAARDGDAAAVALLLQMEEQCIDWFAGDEPRQDEAIRTAALTRIQLLATWANGLPPDADTERDWCRQAADAARREQFHQHETVLRLEEAVPTLIGDGALGAVGHGENRKELRPRDSDEN